MKAPRALRLCAATGATVGAVIASLSGPARALEAADLFDKVSPSVWSVVTQDAQGRPLAGGSAVVIGAGRLVTNCHVLARASSFSVKRENVSYGATLEYPDPDRDLCQIKVANFKAPAVELAPIDRVRVGQRVYAIGNPRGLEVTLSDGLVSGLRRKEDGSLEAVQTTAAMSPGSSGGGLFDSEGRLVGVTTYILRDSQNLNFAAPSAWIGELASRGQAALDRRNAGPSAPARAPAPPSVALAPPTVPAPAPTLPPMPAPADTQAARSGDQFEYLYTDRLSRVTRPVVYRVDRVEDGGRIVFNDGGRVEGPHGDVLQASGAPGGQLDLLSPPGGWGRGDGTPQGQWKINYTSKISANLLTYDLTATAGGSQSLRTPAGDFEVVRIDLRGFLTSRSREMANFFSSDAFKATVWWSPTLRRVVRLEAVSRATGHKSFSADVDESIELTRVTRESAKELPR